MGREPIDDLIDAHVWLSRKRWSAKDNRSGWYRLSVRISRAKSRSLLNGIGNEIRRRRQMLGMSQSVVARSAGVHANVVGRIERGVYNPTVMTLAAIVTALNTSMVDLLRRGGK